MAEGYWEKVALCQWRWSYAYIYTHALEMNTIKQLESTEDFEGDVMAVALLEWLDSM